MGKSFNAELYRQLEKQSRRNQQEDERERELDDAGRWWMDRQAKEVETMRGDW